MGTTQFGLPYPNPDRGAMRFGDVVVRASEHNHPADEVGTMRSSCPACVRLIDAVLSENYGSAITSLLPYLKQQLARSDDDLSEMSEDQARARINLAVNRWIGDIQDPHRGDRRPFK